MYISVRPQGRFPAFSLFKFMGNSARLFLLALVFVCAAVSAHAAVVRGTVSDPLGAAIRGARVNLVENGKAIATVLSGPDGSYELTTSDSGRFVVTSMGTGFALAVSPEFYSGPLDVVTQNLMMRPASVKQDVTVTATGVPTPQAQLSSSVDVIHGDDLTTKAGIIDDLRLMPGVSVVQTGEAGGVTSLFVRGGSSTANKVLIDGMPANDIGGLFDFSTVSSTGLESVEVARGPESVIYGADAAASALNLQTPRGVTAAPVLNYSGDGGNFNTYRNELTLGGTHTQLDYYLAFSRLDTSNSLPLDRYHDQTWAANIGYGSGATQARFTLRYSPSAVGLPGSFEFTGVSTLQKQADQDLYSTGTLEHSTQGDWHNLVRYGVSRKREQISEFAPVGIYDPISTNYYGYSVRIKGANGYETLAGQTVTSYGGTPYPNRSDEVNNRNEFAYQTDYRYAPHHAVYGSFRADFETGAYRYPIYAIVDNVYRTNYEYTLQFEGQFKSRVFYSLGGGVVKNHVFGVKGEPQLGIAYYPVRPGIGLFHGTKLHFNFTKGVQEADIFTELESLRNLLIEFGDASDVTKYNIQPVGAQTSRAYEGGIDQNVWGNALVLKTTLFHNEYGNQAEFVSSTEILANYNLCPPAPASCPAETALDSYYYGAYVNTLDYRAMGVETELDWHPFTRFLLRGGYTYLDAVTQNSFASSALSPITNPTLPGAAANIPIGASSPLVGARPFRRPPHTGFFAAEYRGKKFTTGFTGALASRSDDSTYLAYADFYGGNSLLLPNRNLDYGYAKLDANLAYQVTPRVGIFTQMDNLLSQHNTAPIGYPSLPFNIRAGVKVRLSGR